MTPSPGSDVNLHIRPATTSDHDAVWNIFHQVVASGDTYVFLPGINREDAMAAWFPKGGHTYVAERRGDIVGTYLLKANQPGLGNHVANAGYMVAPAVNGQGIGAAMCEHSMHVARDLGFQAMQFNIVVSTNTRAVALWQRLGFVIVGTLPKVFRHTTKGLVDAYVMYQAL